MHMALARTNTVDTDLAAALASGRAVPLTRRQFLKATGMAGGGLMLAIGLGIRACQAGHRVLFATAAGWVARLADAPTPLPDPERSPLGGAADEAVAPEAEVVRDFVAEVDGRRFGVRLRLPASQAGGAPAPAPRVKGRGTHSAGSDKAGQPSEAVTTPMQGTVLRVLVAEGQAVAEGDVICIVEAMKMENEVAAHRGGVVRRLSVAEGQSVGADQVIAIVD